MRHVDIITEGMALVRLRDVVIAARTAGDIFNPEHVVDIPSYHISSAGKQASLKKAMRFIDEQKAVAQMLAERERMAVMLMMRNRPVHERVREMLRWLATRPAAMTHPEGMQIKVSRTTVGALCGCSREMVGRVLDDMKQHREVFIEGGSHTMVLIQRKQVAA